MALYKNGGWVGYGNFLTIEAQNKDTQIVCIHYEADGYARPHMTPHGPDYEPPCEWRRCTRDGSVTISAATARRWIRRLRAENAAQRNTNPLPREGA
jgi:hypothetical protein